MRDEPESRTRRQPVDPEAKKLSLGPQAILRQADRYSKGVADGPFDFRGLRVPLLYSTNGEVKHAAKDEEPLLTAEDRVARGFENLAVGKTFTSEQQAWLARIREHLIVNLSIDRKDFDPVPILADAGGWKPADRAFEGKRAQLLETLNEAVAA